MTAGKPEDIKMGVKGLLSFMKKHMNQIAMTVDLFHEARTRDGGIELLADFYAFENALLESMWRLLDKECGNYYIRLGLGEYATIDKHLKKVIKYLRSRGIEMVFYVDGARGSSSYQCERKLDTWKEKHKRHLSDLNYLLGVCDGRKKGLRFDPSVLPILLETQFFETLKECSCEINQLPSGGVDCTVVKQLLERPKAFAILGNDTDFCIFKESAFIHVDWFEMPTVGLENEASASDCLNTRMVKQETLSNFLGLEHPELIEFAILCGNDFTFPELKRLEMKEQMGFLDEWDLSEVADWINQNTKVDRHPLVAEQPVCEKKRFICW